jgi:probable HAF family extracellular repeat protein
MKPKILIVTTLPLIALGSGLCNASPIYGVVPLVPPVPGFCEGRAINNAGQAVGTELGQTVHVILWQNGTPTDLLAATPEWDSSVYGINDSGTVTGDVLAQGGVWQPYMWDGTMHIPPTPGSEGGSTRGINGLGEIVGSYTSENVAHAAVWRSGQSLDLQVLPSQDTAAVAINDTGQIAIVASPLPYNGVSNSYLLSDGVLTNLGGLGGKATGARAINNLGQIVGGGDDALGIKRPFVWQNGQLSALPVPDWSTLASAGDINDSGEIIGYYSDFTRSVPFLYDNGTMYDIRTLVDPDSGWDIYEINGINDNGVIIASGVRDGQSSALLLVPLPEPSGTGLLVSGLFLLLRRSRKRVGLAA